MIDIFDCLIDLINNMVDDTSPAQFIRPELEQQTSTPGA